MGNKDVYKYGEQILNSINRAAETRNFSNLSREVRNSISEAAGGVLESVQKGVFSWRKNNRTPFFSVKIKKNKGKGKIVIGSIITFFSVVDLIDLISGGSMLGISGIGDGIGVFIWRAIFLFLGIRLIIAGRKNRNLIKNYFNFGKIIGNRSYITMEELADKTGLSTQNVVGQIKQMKEFEYLPYATMDKEETTLMLTDEIYKEYIKSKMHSSNQTESFSPKQEKQSVSSNSAEKPSKVQYFTIDENLPDDVKSILRDGNDYLNKIRYYNDLIPDTETMSDKLYTLEATVLSIFKKLKEAPEIARDLRKLMSYYLPTTEKLLQSYVDLRKETHNVENIVKSQKEIEEATDVINDAFVKLLNQLFESTSWDISSDISVLKTMMKQDALL
jgi:hypothetical protein